MPGGTRRRRRGISDLARDDFSSNRHLAPTYSWSMIFSDLPSPAEASSHATDRAKSFAQAGNRYSLFGIMLLLPPPTANRSALVVLVVTAPPNAGLVAPLGGAVEPLVRAPKAVH